MVQLTPLKVKILIAVHDNGNTFFTGLSYNGNTTLLTINGVNYTTIGTNNVCRTYFSLDSSGNTNWVKPNVNFQPGN